MTEVLFYHLQRQPLEAVLPALLERSLERSWRVVVETGSRERLEALDAHLWTYRDEAFLPHGSDAESAADQPVFLTTGDENPNGAQVRFFVDGAIPRDMDGYSRIVVMFDGNDETALTEARKAWQAAWAGGHEATYWQQSDRGRWEKRAG